MSVKVQTLHVLPAGDAWVIENGSGLTFARETGRLRAIERATEIGRSCGIRFIVVHRRSGALDEFTVPLVWEMSSDEQIIIQEVREAETGSRATIEHGGGKVQHESSQGRERERSLIKAGGIT